MIDGLLIGITAQVDLKDLAAVDQHHQRVVELHALDPQRMRHVTDVELVFAIGREDMIDHHAATRTQRQTLNVGQVFAALVVDVGRAHRACRRVAHGQHSDVARRGQILIEKRRRHLQHFGDVVEAVAVVVLRQQRSRVQVQVEQIAHGIGVFAAVEAVQRHLTGINATGRGFVDAAFQPAHQLGHLRFGRARLTGRRHEAPTGAIEDLFPDLGIGRNGVGAHRVEGQAAGPIVGVVAVDAVLVEHRKMPLLCGHYRARTSQQHTRPQHAFDHDPTPVAACAARP